MTDKRPIAAVIGGGPAGLTAAEVLARGGLAVTIYERMPSPARKFLLAGRGGLNLTHSEPFETFLLRYGAAAQRLRPSLAAFGPDALRSWCHDLGVETFIGSSGRVFPKSLKSSPLLRAWLRRLDRQGVAVKYRHGFRGWTEAGHLLFETPGGDCSENADITVLAMGGASWPRLGSDGGWTGMLRDHGIPLAPLRPANCGFETAWSSYMREHHAGAPLKNISVNFAGPGIRGECTITAYGLEGGVIYALSSVLREAIEAHGRATLAIDLKPDMAVAALAQKLALPRGKTSLSNHLRKCAGLTVPAIALLRETSAPFDDPERLAAHIKNVQVPLTNPRPVERAISTAGGISFNALDDNYMLKQAPGVFCAGEMLDWEAPTGGYLLQACFATGAAAAHGALAWLANR